MNPEAKKRVLIVDDQVVVAESLKMILEYFGLEVHLARSGREALDLFEPGKFALIFTDFEMPGMNGHELASIIKAREPNQPVVLVTAYGDLLGDTEPPPQTDMILPKPWEMAEVKGMIEKFCS